MAEVARIERAADLPFDLSACGNYGGWPFRTVCAGLGRQSLGAASSFFNPNRKTGAETLDLIAALKARKASQVGGEPSADEKPKNPFAASTAKRRAIAEAAGDVPTDLVASVPDTSTPSVNPPDGIPDDVAYAEPVKPPKRGEAVVGEKLFAIVGDCELEAKGEPLSAATRIKGMSKGDLVALWMAVAERLDARFLAAAPELSKAKPSAVGVFKRDVLKAEITELAQYLAGCSDDELAGRAPQAPANAENATLEVGVSGDEDAASEPETREEILGGTKPAASSEPVDLANRALRAARTLYIDCAPRKTDVVFFSDLVRPFALAAAKELGVVSYRVPQYKRGEDNVVARLEVAIGDGSLVLPENLVVETSIPSARICLEILIPAYDRVVERLGW